MNIVFYHLTSSITIAYETGVLIAELHFNLITHIRYKPIHSTQFLPHVYGCYSFFEPILTGYLLSISQLQIQFFHFTDDNL